MTKPKIIIPDTWRGIPVDGAMERALAREENKENEKLTSIKTPVNINPQEYLQIPNSNYVIAKLEPDWTKGFDYENSHKQVLQKGLEMPTPSLFISHFLNVIRAYQGKNKLYDGKSQEVSKQELEDIYKHLNTKHINDGAWSWLNSRFVQGAGFNNLDLETVTGTDSNGNLLTQKTPLEECLMENCYADINFNSQGLATKKSRNQNYKHGENIYFYYPRESCVARFRAFFVRADLGCYGDPGISVASLGVFSVCEANATPQKI